MNVNHLFHSLLLAAAVAALPVGSVFAADVFPVRTSRGGYPLIIPRPKEFRAAPGTFALPAQLTVAAPQGFDLAPLGRAYATFVKEGKIIAANPGKSARCRFELATQGVPASPEGYSLAISADGIAVRAGDERGLFYGMQSLVWILRNRESDTLKGCTITDWPDLAMRGIFFELPRVPPSKVDRLCHVIDVLGSLKYNTILIEFADNFPFRDSPFTKRKETFSRADVEKIMAAAKRNRIELIPLLQIASHTLWMTHHRDWEKLSEGKARSPWRSLYCLSNPEVQPIIETAVRETADLLKPRYFHFALDEIIPCGFPKCPKCKAADPLELLLRHVAPLKKILDERKITMIAFQDEFFGNSDPCGMRKRPMEKLPEALGKDIVINSWEYGEHVGPGIGESIRQRGFDKLLYMSYSDAIGNSWRLPVLARRMKAMGNILAYWYSAPATLDKPERSKPTAYPATVAQANYAWNSTDADFNSLPVDWAGILIELLDGGRSDAFRGAATPVPLAGACNRSFDGPPRFPRFDAALAAKAKRIAAADPAKFELATDGGTLNAVVLAGAPDDGLDDAPLTIPIGTRARGAAFLVGAAAASSFSLPRINTKLPVGEFKIVYEDGKSAVIPLTLRFNLNDWNSVIGGNFSRPVLRGNDLDGALFNFGAVEWRNPNPERAIREIVFTTRRNSAIAPMLFALSLADAERSPAGLPAAARRSVGKAPEETPVKRTVFLDFANGLPAGSIVAAPGVADLRHRIVRDPETGDAMLEFTFSESKPGSRCMVDLPVELGGKFGTLLFDLQVSDFSAVYRADVFWANRKRNRFRGVLDYSPELDSRRHTVSLSRSRFSERENGGIEPEEAAYLRINFFLNAGRRPCTIRIGKLGFSDRQLPGRVNDRTEVR